ncbi:MAG: DUF6065 family protein [Alphaproteobacteria bacterium]|nr:DUF6065 family protein [Alphaproteobacteria bacterium]
MKLTAYTFDNLPFEIRPAPFERAWMDATRERYAYRCLPLTIANTHGWEILCPSRFGAVWDGGENMQSIQLIEDPVIKPYAVSHFGFGILTFHIHALFRTEPGFDMFVQGPVNQPKDGIAPLSGVVETDWSPYTFTMNWKFTRKDHPVFFEKDEPFCHIFPVRRSDLELMEPGTRPLTDVPELKREYDTWNASRTGFIADLKQAGTEAYVNKWQKLYQRGVMPDGETQTAPEHRTRLRVKPFVEQK